MEIFLPKYWNEVIFNKGQSLTSSCNWLTVNVYMRNMTIYQND